MSSHIPQHVMQPTSRNGTHSPDLTRLQRDWIRNGAVILRNFVPEDKIQAYFKLRDRLNLGRAQFSRDWAFLDHPELADMVANPKLAETLKHITGEDMGIGFVLSGLHSSQRGWHQDDYLNTEELKGRYLAVWIALEDLDESAGSFEYIPGSHRWLCLRRKKTTKFLDNRIDWDAFHPRWAIYAEPFINSIAERNILEKDAMTQRFYAKKGDVLIWHGCTYHRGRTPESDKPRHSLIGHYSSVDIQLKLADVYKGVIQHGGNGGPMFVPKFYRSG